GRFIDGGVWANNPAMVGVVEAAAFLNIPLASVDILSIGTTTQPFSLAKNANASALRWNVGLLNLALEAQAEAAHAQASLLVQEPIHGVNIAASEGRFALDGADPDTLGDLANLGRNEVEKRLNWKAIAERFLNGDEVAPFTPLPPTFKL